MRALLSGEDLAALEQALLDYCTLARDRTVWHVNSTESGGGVAEMLQSLLPYAAGAGVDCRWLVMEGSDAFFDVTKRIHNWLHEGSADVDTFTEDAQRSYREVSESEGSALAAKIRAGDIVILHDPQTAGLIAAVNAAGGIPIWRCHVGVDEPGPLARQAWDFLRGDVASAAAVVFSRQAYAWDGLDRGKVFVMPPCIDVLSAKNRPIDDESIAALLAEVDLPAETSGRMVLQVSRWDRLKDPTGVMAGFTAHVCDERVHLVLAGPDVEGVTDDPEGQDVLDEVRAQWEQLPRPVRERVHIVCIQMEDLERNALTVNALQRTAAVVVQKSLAEGFGLTVAEAMWKRRPVVGSRVGGIQDQIVDGESGVLLDDPSDADAFGKIVADLVDDPERIVRLGEAAHGRVCENFLPQHHFANEAHVLRRALS